MASLETACHAKDLELYVPPPKSPEMNGAVERANGAGPYEFYATYDLPPHLNLNELINSFAHLYNHYRPHGALQVRTRPPTLPPAQPPRPRPLHSPEPGQCLAHRSQAIYRRHQRAIVRYGGDERSIRI